MIQVSKIYSDNKLTFSTLCVAVVVFGWGEKEKQVKLIKPTRQQKLKSRKCYMLLALGFSVITA